MEERRRKITDNFHHSFMLHALIKQRKSFLLTSKNSWKRQSLYAWSEACLSSVKTSLCKRRWSTKARRIHTTLRRMFNLNVYIHLVSTYTFYKTFIAMLGLWKKCNHNLEQCSFRTPGHTRAPRGTSFHYQTKWSGARLNSLTEGGLGQLRTETSARQTPARPQ